MARIADEQLARLTRSGRAELPDLAFGLAIGVAAEVVGLTESRPGIQRRLDRFFPEEFGRPGFTRRRNRREDLISHLLDEGCSAGVAILETDVFLSRLCALPGLRMVSPPRVTVKAEIDSYQLRNLVVAVVTSD